MNTHLSNNTGQQSNTHQYPLHQLYFYLTNGCNLRCRHCWVAPKFQGEEPTASYIDPDLFTSIIYQAKELGLTGVKLTGGEPLLHPEIDALIETVRGEDLELRIETNGVLCTRSLAENIAQCKDSFVSISLDGVDAPTHEWVRGVHGSFDDAISGIKTLTNSCIETQIIMTLMKRNTDHIEPMIRLAEELKVGSVKFNILNPMSRGEGMHKSEETLSIAETLKLGSWVEKVLSPLTGLKLFFDQPPAFRPLGNMFGSSGDGCISCGVHGILGVLADGSYALCGIGETIPDLVFGHAASDALAHIWNESPVLRELRSGLPNQLEGICSECLMKKVCLGSCIAQNYYRKENLWAPFWVCEEAAAEGLFPETRRIPA